MPSEGQRSFYEILGVSPSASREEIDKACVDLWYRYHPLCTTQLWGDLSRQMEDIRCTLLNPGSRAAYDKRLARRQSTSFSNPQDKAQSGDASAPVTVGHIQAERANNDLLQVPKSNFRMASYCIAMATAWLFNETIDWMSPQNWSDIATIGWLVMFFGLAATGLVWSVFHLFPVREPTVTAE